MTESTIYWIARLDEIREFLVGIQVVSTLIAGVGGIGMLVSACIMAMEKSHGWEDAGDYKAAKAVFALCCKLIVPTAILATMCSLACTFMPTTKEMVAIKVIPAIASSEQASRLKGIGNDAIDVAAEWFKSLAKTKEEETDGSK